MAMVFGRMNVLKICLQKVLIKLNDQGKAKEDTRKEKMRKDKPPKKKMHPNKMRQKQNKKTIIYM